MNKKIFLASALAGLMAVSAQAQLKFGLKAGLNVTNMSLSQDVLDTDNRAGWFAGPTVKFTLPIVGLGLDASALYDYRSSKLNADGETEKIKQQMIAIPINVRYGIGLGSLASAFIYAGPQWGINVGDSEFNWTDGSSYSLKKSQFSVNVGLGVELLNHLQVSANYNIACGKSGEFKAIDLISNSRSHNNAWQISAAYYF